MDNILTAAELNIIPVRIPAKVTADSAPNPLGGFKRVDLPYRQTVVPGDEIRIADNKGSRRTAASGLAGGEGSGGPGGGSGAKNGRMRRKSAHFWKLFIFFQ
nr:hypothetical protein [Thioalkalivibrio sp.]